MDKEDIIYVCQHCGDSTDNDQSVEDETYHLCDNCIDDLN